ncbi:hypothetical protein [Pedobacter metabolipauper]|uniref:Uncharacterized protein n=1 Tax=Pedobacter metabolipauper TaxID=425513 RepID=A0A4R6T0V6_9SPHI|nr:hypothetical protein [Pedobacter metabolipauper]TDQ11218.1 hypothetical protein ATK78_0335 [Pedobacter metabolipauper]
MNSLSPWALLAGTDLAKAEKPLFSIDYQNFLFQVFMTIDSLWISTTLPGKILCNFRCAYSPGGFTVSDEHTSESGITLILNTVYGRQTVAILVDTQKPVPVLRYITTLKPKADLVIPYWPKDMLFTAQTRISENSTGKIHASQWGTRTGFIYMSPTRPKAAPLLYLQNLSAISAYCEQTETSLGDTVGGEWPELGFSLPASKKPLKAGKEVTISDAFIAFGTVIPKTEAEVMTCYLDLLARIYLLMPLPDTQYKPWPEILQNGLKDLTESPGCWSQVAGHKYFNAYVSDYDTPPEIMVQLAILLPLLDYVEWSGTKLEVMQTIKEGLPDFYNEKLGTIMRWLPAAEDKLKGEEEQKMPMVMDSWYLHHPLLNLSRLALKGDKIAKALFLNSLPFAIRVARHFKYIWPVFYKMDTLEVIKAETAEGKGGEKDVAGLYAHVMLQAFELTKERKYLTEAEHAAKTLKGYGFDIFYQANNTAFSAGALLRLFKITGNKDYLGLSYMCLASIFRNTQLWDCNYGYGKNFPKFFALYPLNDAPYTAAYEEQEVFCAIHDYLKHAEGVEILPSVKLLLAEFIRYVVDRSVYYYPPMLPPDMLEEDPKTGEVDPKLWIALEDLQDGWLKSGTVGQEVYGAGNAFGILPRHYLRIPGRDFMVYVDYPIADLNAVKGKPVSFSVLGSSELECRMMLVKTGRSKIPEIEISINGQKHPAKGKKVTGGNQEFKIPGDCSINLKFT